jgi:hypothetical protein
MPTTPPEWRIPQGLAPLIVNHAPTNRMVYNKNPEPRDESSQGSQSENIQ